MLLQFTPDDIELFWSNADRSGGSEACWPWMSGFFETGYGRFYLPGARVDTGKNVQVGAHRVALALDLAPVEREGVTIELVPHVLTCHNCPNGDNRWCVNPIHLFHGTRRDNAQDMTAKDVRVLPGRGYLNESQIEEAIDLYERGLSQRKIGDRFGVDYLIVGRAIRKAGVKTRRGRSFGASDDVVQQVRMDYASRDISMSVLARRYGVSTTAVFRMIHKE